MLSEATTTTTIAVKVEAVHRHLIPGEPYWGASLVDDRGVALEAVPKATGKTPLDSLKWLRVAIAAMDAPPAAYWTDRLDVAGAFREDVDEAFRLAAIKWAHAQRMTYRDRRWYHVLATGKGK